MARLYGTRVMLREYQKEDIENIRKWCNNPEITKNLSDIFLYPHTLLQTEQFMNSMMENSNPNVKGFIIAELETGKYIGQIDLIKIDWKNRIGILGIVIGDLEKQGKGYGEDAIKILQKFVFEELNLNRLELTVHDYNQRAYKCYKKCGFVEEGRIREHFYTEGKYSDTIYMGILKREYELINCCSKEKK